MTPTCTCNRLITCDSAHPMRNPIIRGVIRRFLVLGSEPSTEELEHSELILIVINRLKRDAEFVEDVKRFLASYLN